MTFITNNFMLHNDISKKLYNIAKDKKIIDYHCHLDPKLIAEDKEFEDITEIWLLGDHYKWRAMRANGVSETNITGNVSNKEKFKAWAYTLESTLGNPLFHWSAMELKKYFDIDELLNGENWEEIWERANKVIKDKKLSPKKLIEISNVEYVCTTDGPLDDLRYHDEIKKDTNFKVRVEPGFRPDTFFNLRSEIFLMYVNKLSEITGKKINTYDEYIEAMYERITYFNDKGCNISDHGISKLEFTKYSKEEVEDIFTKVLNKESITDIEYMKYLTAFFIDLSKKYKELGWVMQLHFGAIRNNDVTLLKTIGFDAGSDSIMDQGNVAKNLNLLLSLMKENNSLPKFIIYNLDPSQNNIVACSLANFSSNLPKGYLQYGSGWWFNDTKEGMLRQLKSLADQGLLMNFVGMLTDSRSFVSYIRHDYFRRILCEFIGDLVIKGEIPNDDRLLRKLIENISYKNALEYFGLE
ncbi:glucuronate isomerase [Streptobacillus moniliformis]|uniref:glucuronate isomerase n=1 Tax=Streptobacillus moniliformis TaxID=34105 RepID=UPI0007E3660F|nr:glucuronate isomerase [Streptobacillus moniliformis]